MNNLNKLTSVFDVEEPAPEKKESTGVDVDFESLSEQQRSIGENSGHIDAAGMPTDDYLDFLATSDTAVKYGLTKPRPTGIMSNVGHALAKGYHSVARGYAKTFGAENAARYHDEVLRKNRQWDLSPDENIPGWIAYQAANAVASTAPTVAAGAAMAMIPQVSIPLVSAAMGTTTFAQLFGDNLDKVREDSGGMLNPYEELGAAWVITGLQAGVEVGLGPQRLLAQGLAGRGLAKFAESEANRTTMRKLGKMLFEGKMNRVLASGVEEGVEEVMQLGIHDVTMNRLAGKEFSHPSEYRENFLAGAVGGTFLGMGGAMLNSVADESSKHTVNKKVLAPVTEDTVGKIYKAFSPELNQEAMLKTQGSFDALRQNLPSKFQPMVSLMERISYNLAAMDGTKKPEEYIDEMKTAFVDNMTEAKATQLNAMIDGKEQDEVIEILGKEVKGFTGLIKSAKDTLHLKMVKDINDRVDQDLRRGYTPIEEDNVDEFKNFLSVVFGKQIVNKLWAQKSPTATIPFEEVRDMANRGQLPSDTMKNLMAEGRVNGVEAKDDMGRSFTADIIFNDDFSITLRMAKPKSKEELAKETADVEERAKLQQALKGEKKLAPSDTELAIANEALREVRLAKRGQVLAEFNDRWSEFREGRDQPTTEKVMAQRLVDAMNAERIARTKRLPAHAINLPASGVLEQQEVQRAIDEMEEVLSRKALPGHAINLPESGELQRQEVARATRKAYEQAEAAARGLPPHAIPMGEGATTERVVGGYDLGRMSQEADPAQSLLNEIQQNVQGEVGKWTKDQLNAIAMNLGVKLKNYKTDRQKANAIMMALPVSKRARTDTEALLKAANNVLTGKKVNNSQVDEVIKGQYLDSYKLAVFYKEADAETIMHEWFHHLTRNSLLPSYMKDSLFDSFSVNGKWTYESDERAVDAFMTWLSTQELPANTDPQLLKTFNGLKKIISKTYQSVVGTDRNVQNTILNQRVSEKAQADLAAIGKAVVKKARGMKDYDSSLDNQLSLFEGLTRDNLEGVRGNREEFFKDVGFLESKGVMSKETARQIKEIVDLDKIPLAQKEVTPQMVEVSPEVQEAFDGLLDPVEDGTVEAIYGEALAESMENSRVGSDYMSPDEMDERISLSLEGKVLNQKSRSKKQSLWRQLHGKYKSHERVVEALGMKEGETLKDVSVSQLRNALKKDTGQQLEWLQRKGFPDSNLRELRARSPEGYADAQSELEDETTSFRPTPVPEGEESLAERVAPIAESLAAEQLDAVSWGPREITSDINAPLQRLRNSANRWMQRGMRVTHGLRDISKFLGQKFNEQVWGRLSKPNNEIAKTQNAIDDDYERNMTERFLSNTAEQVELPSGSVMPLNDMIALYAMTEGKNLSMGDLFNQNNEMNPRYGDVVAWLGANDFASIEKLNEAVDYINSRPEIRDKVIAELDYITKVSNEHFAGASKKYKEITGKDILPLNKRWYTSLTRSNDVLHEGDIASVFENFEGKIPNYNGITNPSAFNTRFGGKGGKVSLDYRANFHHHVYAMVNYLHKAEVIRDAMAIIRNPAFQDAMRKRFGDDASLSSALDVLIRREMSPSGRWKKDEGIGDNTLGQLRANVYNSLLSWNLGMFPMQLSSWPMAFSEMGLNGKTLTQAVKNTLWTMQKIISGSPKAWQGSSVREAFKGWDVWENMLKYGAAITRRVSNPEAENLRRRNRQSWIAKNFKLAHNFIERGNLIMEAGDMAVVIGTWNTIFEMKREQLAREHSSWDDEQVNAKAGEIATEAVMSTQSPSTVGEKSLWQTGTELEKMQIPFSGQAFTVMKSLMSNTVLPVIESIKRSETTGETIANIGKTIMDKQYAMKVLVGWVLPAIAMGAVARRRRQKDKEEIARDIVCYALGTVPFIGNMIWMSVALGWKDGGPATFYHDLASSITEGVKGVATGDMSKVDKIGRAASMITGTPIAFNRFLEKVISKYSTHDSSFNKAEVLEALGLKPKD